MHMNFDTFVLKCQEVINGEFDLLRIGDRYVETDYGKLRIVHSFYAPETVESVEYSAFGIEVKFRPYKDHEGNHNFAKILEQLSLLVASRWMERQREIDAIEMYVRELEKIRKAPVTYIRHYGMRPRVEVVLDGTEDLTMFSINGSGIKYLPSRAAMGDEKHKAGAAITTRSVSEIKAVPITVYEKIMERRCGSRRMDMFISEGVEYIRPEEGENFGRIQVGLPCCDIMRVEPIVLGNKIVEFLRGCSVLDDMNITVAYFDFDRRQTDPCKGHVLSAEFRLSSNTNPDFAIWFRLYDNAQLTLTCGLDETSELAGKLITGYLDPIQLGLTN
jgi:hypothetical protein